MVYRVKWSEVNFCWFLVIVLFSNLSPHFPKARGSASTQKPFQLIWHFEAENAVNLTPVLSRASVIFPRGDGSIVSIMLSNGDLNWKTEIGGNLSAIAHADETSVFVASENYPNPAGKTPARGSLRSLSSRSGLTLWVRPLLAPMQGGLISNEAAVFGGTADGRLYAIKKFTGEELWVRQNRVPFVSQPVLVGDVLMLGDEEGNLWAIDVATGKTNWRYQTGKSLRAAVAVVGENIFAGSNDGFVYALNKQDGRLRWRTRTGGAVQSVTPTKRCLIATSLDNFVYCLSTQRGHKLWKRQMPGRVAAQPVVIDEGVLFAPLAGEECIILNQKDGRKINSIFVGEDNNLAASPLLAGHLLLLTTRKGLLAFSTSQDNPTPLTNESGLP